MGQGQFSYGASKAEETMIRIGTSCHDMLMKTRFSWMCTGHLSTTLAVSVEELGIESRDHKLNRKFRHR